MSGGGANNTAVIIGDNFGGRTEYAAESSVAPTLKATHYKFPPWVTVSAGFCTEHSANSRGVGFQEEVSPTLRAGVTPACIVGQHLFENHSQDTRYKGPLEVAPALPAQLGTGGNNQPFVVEGQPVYCLQGNGIDRADTAGCNGRGVREDVCYTLNTIDRPAVAYGIGNGQANQSVMEERVGALNCMHDQQAVVFDKEVYQSGINATGGHYIAEGGPAPTLRTTGHPPGVSYGVDCRNATETPELNGTLQAKPNGGFSMNCNQIVRTQYIVRRLTPTECARLQGFADCWGHIEKKESLTDAEWCFWSGVILTKALIEGTVICAEGGDLFFAKSMKPYKHKTKAQTLAWYNKLHTDSAEYKMWGNGIALPPALYCMQGITDVLTREEDDSWML